MTESLIFFPWLKMQQKRKAFCSESIASFNVIKQSLEAFACRDSHATRDDPLVARLAILFADFKDFLVSKFAKLTLRQSLRFTSEDAKSCTTKARVRISGQETVRK